ncbi:MAG: cytidylate kinase family protein [Rikenellaceae bacterium]
MNKTELIRRYLIFTLSTFIISFGISAIVRSDLGTSPISSTPYVFSINTPLSIGTYLFILCFIFIIIQMAFMGRKSSIDNKYELLLQIPISFLFGLCTDLAMWVLSDLHPQSYIAKMVTLVVGCFILALGIALEVKAGVAMMGGEYTVQVASKRFKKEFGTIKIIFDVTLVCIAIISSLLFAGKIEGIREGTIITALITGPFVKIIMPRLNFIGRWQEVTPILATKLSPQTAAQSVLITISREYGSGGHAIGEMLAKRLNIPFYDKNLVEMVAKEGGFSESFVSENEQNLNSSLYDLILQDYEAPLERSLSPKDMLFVAQSNVINRVASEGSCVIVGRCSSYILDKYPNNISVFIHANMEKKITTIIEKYGIEPDSAAMQIKRIDKARADHYFHYTGNRWGDARNYQLCCDSGLLSEKEICETIEKIYIRALANF